MLGSTAAVLVFFLCFNRKRNVFVAEETSELHKRKLLKFLKWKFSNFSFWGESVNRNSIIMISKGYHYVINLGIFSYFLYQYIDRIYREGRTQIPPSSSATIDPLPKISIDLVYTNLWQKTYRSRWNPGNLGSPLSIDPQAHYPQWV